MATKLGSTKSGTEFMVLYFDVQQTSSMSELTLKELQTTV
jgi:hypothetical protein